MEIKREKFYYEENDELFKTDSVEIYPGVTALVGCNGSGKSTMAQIIKEYCKTNNIKVFYYDVATSDNANNNMDKFLLGDNIEAFATMITSSEGEKIHIGIGNFIGKIGKFQKNKENLNKPFFIIIDGIDSGFSLDNIIEYRKFMHYIIEKSGHKGDIYVILTANDYELTVDSKCLDVYTGEYVEFKNYEDYKEFVLNSSKIKKEERYSNY